MKLEGLTINFIGDSITEGVGASAPEFKYVDCFSRIANLKEARNYGISTTRIALQKGTPIRPKDDYVDVNSFCERYQQMDDNADAVVVFGGTNDYGHGDAPMGTFADRTPDTFYGACHTLFKGLVQKYLGKPIVVMTPLHRVGELIANPTRNKAVSVGTTLLDYVNALRQVAEYYSLPVLDLYATSGMQPAIPEVKDAFLKDGIHPTDAGHEIIARKLKAFMEVL